MSYPIVLFADFWLAESAAGEPLSRAHPAGLETHPSHHARLYAAELAVLRVDKAARGYEAAICIAVPSIGVTHAPTTSLKSGKTSSDGEGLTSASYTGRVQGLSKVPVLAIIRRQSRPIMNS